MTVYLKEGAEQKCRYLSFDDEFLTCTNKYDEKFQIELATIDKIVLPRAGKYAKEWAIWGAVGGAIGGAIYSVRTFWDFVPSGHVAVAGIGAGLGALGGGLTGATIGSLGGPIYISKEAALAK